MDLLALMHLTEKTVVPALWKTGIRIMHILSYFAAGAIAKAAGASLRKDGGLVVRHIMSYGRPGHVPIGCCMSTFRTLRA